MFRCTYSGSHLKHRKQITWITQFDMKIMERFSYNNADVFALIEHSNTNFLSLPGQKFRVLPKNKSFHIQ